MVCLSDSFSVLDAIIMLKMDSNFSYSVMECVIPLVPKTGCGNTGMFTHRHTLSSFFDSPF